MSTKLPLSPVDRDRLSGPLQEAAEAYANVRAARGVDETGFDVKGAREALALQDHTKDVTLPWRAGAEGGVSVVHLGTEAPRLIYFHGGGFVGGMWTSHGQIADALARNTGLGAVFSEYRLAPEHPFPAAHDDAEAVFDSIVADQPVVLAGDSVGAALALHLAQRAKGTNRIAALALFAPMLDFDPKTSDYMRNFPRAHAMISNYVGGEQLSDLRLQVLSGDMACLPPTLVQIGGADYVRDDGLRLATEMVAQGAPVVLENWPNMPHVWHRYTPQASEASGAIARASRFLTDHLDAARA